MHPAAELHRDLGPLDNETWLALLGHTAKIQGLAVRSVEEEVVDTLQQLNATTQSDQGYVLFVARDAAPDPTDPINGWRPVWSHNPQSPRSSRVINALRKKLRWTARQSPYFSESGFHRVWYLDGVALDDVLEGHHRIIARLLGQREAMMAICSVTPRLEMYFALSRRTAGAYEEPEVNCALAAMHALAPLAVRWARLLGVIDANGLLTRRERTVLTSLLHGRSEKEISAELRLRPNYVHKVVNAIYKRFGVQSRAQLLHLCLTPSPPSSAPSPGRIPFGTLEPIEPIEPIESSGTAPTEA